MTFFLSKYLIWTRCAHCTRVQRLKFTEIIDNRKGYLKLTTEKVISVHHDLIICVLASWHICKAYPNHQMLNFADWFPLN